MRGVVLVVAPVLVALAAILAAGLVRAQERERDEVHFGAGSCAAQACHGGAFADRSEYKIWATQDRHSKAYEVLASDLGKRMGERLGIEPTKSAQCLNCHGTIGVKTADTFDPADGVSCELCHGGAKHWLGPHAAPKWMDKTPAQKEELGLRDLSTPAKRVAMCAECHVAAPGRDISHRIMAAGHPPLVFDAAKFMHDMPVHWKDETDQTVATWVEGQRANGIALLGHVERAAAKANGTPDWTVLDCYSCHHPIYTGSVYEKRPARNGSGGLTFDTSSIRVFSIVAGDPAFADKLELTDSDMLRLARQARDAAAGLSAMPAETDRAALIARLDAYLAKVADGSAFAPRAEMQQLASALHVFAADRTSESFRTAFAALDAALATTQPYDGAACAKLARTALGR